MQTEPKKTRKPRDLKAKPYSAKELANQARMKRVAVEATRIQKAGASTKETKIIEKFNISRTDANRQAFKNVNKNLKLTNKSPQGAITLK